MHQDTKLWDQLNCIHTALNILNNPASTIALRTDPTRFYNRLYALLGRMSGAVCPSDGPSGPSSTLRDVAANYGRSNTPAARAVEQMIHREQIARLENNKNAGAESTIGGLDIGRPDGELGTTSSSHHHGRVSVTEAERLTDVLLSCLHSLLINRRREVTIKRVLAFAKRLTSVALTMVSVHMCLCIWLIVTLLRSSTLILV